MRFIVIRTFAPLFAAALAVGAAAADKMPAAAPVPPAAASAVCPADRHAVGQRPPAGTEWKCVDAKGVADGPWLNWYADGQLMSERQMKKGREHGRQRSWWPNGQLMMEGVSVEGHRYQGFQYWTIDGRPTQLEVEKETVVQPAPPATRSTPP